MKRLEKILSEYGLLAHIDNPTGIAIGWEAPGFRTLYDNWTFAKVSVGRVDSLCDALEAESDLAENLWNIIQKFES